MKTFLQIVAEDLHKKFGNDLSRTAIVFPNKRAGLFFNEYLAKESDQPIWAPAFLSISDLFQSLSTLKKGDPIFLICELYKAFKEATESKESLDEFYFWGELLMSDFDDVDKNLVDADRLFSNLEDLKKISDDYTFLDKEQEQAIKSFFQQFSIEKRTVLKERFISLWDELKEVYHLFRDHLSALGYAYEGMIYRDVVSKLDGAQFVYDRYVFVGFNVLNQVETQLFEYLKESNKALFYWDYDLFYTKRFPFKHEAGEFINRNLKKFPNELDESYFNCLSNPKKVRFIAAPTENAQARYLTEWLHDTLSDKTIAEKENAVVLCNESLLLPVLHSIPSEVKNVNITMGFPLSQTPVYSFIKAAFDLQTVGYDQKSGRYTFESVQSILKHPYIRQLSDKAEMLERELTSKNRFYPLPSELMANGDALLTKLFTPQTGNKKLCEYVIDLLKDISVLFRDEKHIDYIYDQLYRESLFKSYTLINRFINLMDTGELQVKTDTLRRLIDKQLSTANIPFHGEPAIGLQIMGVLETRNLDFRNLVMLSLNEGQLPKSEGDPSFIPYNLRKAFGMTTIEHKNSVYAYYFYRLIQRAEQVTLMYNNSSDGLNKGECSRFMLQFLVEWPHEINIQSLEAEQTVQSSPAIEVVKEQDILRRLRERFDFNTGAKAGILSPSALNTYMDCGLKFYFRYVVGLKPPDEVSNEIDSALFGTIFHLSAQWIYEELTKHGQTITKEDLEKLAYNPVKLQRFVDRAFCKEFFQLPENTKPLYNGIQLINSKVIYAYLKQLLHNDARDAPFEMIAMENRVSEKMEIETGDGAIQLSVGGTIDRMDIKENTLRIVDYKTGGKPLIPKGVEDLFTPDSRRPGYIFQIFLYSTIVNRNPQILKDCGVQPHGDGEKRPIAPSILYIHQAASEDYSSVVQFRPSVGKYVAVTDFSEYEEEFRGYLDRLLKEIFDPKSPFTQTDDLKECAYCDFKRICKR
ncbi:MAG: PD-(D/E)XK nuclease family protein [Bacteroidaceae bacterium]